MLSSRLPASDSPRPDPRRENCLQVALGQNARVEEHTTKREAPGSIQDSATTRIANLQIYPDRESKFKSDDSRTSENEVFPNSMLDAHGGKYGNGIDSAAIYMTRGSGTWQNPCSRKHTIRLRIPGSSPNIKKYSKNCIFVVLWLYLVPLKVQTPPGWPSPCTRRGLSPYWGVELLWQYYSVWERCSRPG